MSGGGNGSFIAQVMAPGGGILLIPFTRAVIACLFVVTTTTFVMGVARIHMFILSFLSAGMWISLGVFQKAYTACSSTTGMRLFLAIAAYENRIVYDLDAINAFAQSGPLDKRTFVIVDDQIRERYYARFKVLLPLGSLLELLSLMQGHHNSGPNWQGLCYCRHQCHKEHMSPFPALHQEN